MIRTLVALAALSVGWGRPLYPSDVRTCSTDSDCRVYGDRDSVCETASGLCTCGAGYSTLTATAEILSGPSTYNKCFSDGGTIAQEMTNKIDITITINFPTGDCSRVAELEPLFNTAVETNVGTQKPFTSHYTCPVYHTAQSPTQSPTQSPQTLVPTPAPIPATSSPGTPVPVRAGIIVSLVISGTIQDLFTAPFINFDIEVLRNLGQTSLSILDPPPQWNWWMYESDASNLLCQNSIDENAVVLGYFGSGACRSASCLSIAQFNSDTGMCDRNSFSSSDDDLSDGALAGIICGSVVGAVIIGLLIYCCLCHGKSDEEDEDIEAGEEEEEHPDGEKNSPDSEHSSKSS